MSFDEVKDIKITIKKWVIVFFMVTITPLAGVAGLVINFYFDTVSYKKETSREMSGLKDEVTECKASLKSKVSSEEMKELKGDIKQEMRDIKNLLNILIEKE